MIFVFSVCLLLLLHHLLTKNNNYWKSKNIPFERPFLFFGNFFGLVRRKEHMSDTLRALYNKHKTSPYVGIHIFHQPNLLVRSPEIIKHVLVKDFDKFTNRPIATNESINPIAFHSIFFAKDARWRNLRTKMTPVFTSGKIKLMFPLMKKCAHDLNVFLKSQNGEVIEAKNITKRYSVNVISSCAFGINANCFENGEIDILKMATRLLDTKSFIRSFSVFSYFFAPKLVEIFRLTFSDKTATNYMTKVFESALRERGEKQIERHDFIDLINNLRKNESKNESYKFDDVTMASQAVSFFIAGNDTSSLAFSLALYELALHEDVQGRLRQEICQFIKEPDDMTYENIQEMKYLDMVLCETLRKHPVVSTLNRVSNDNYTFKETGFTLEKGVPIVVPVIGLHFDPEYFPNPEKFDPERFKDKNNIKPYTYMPFSEGPRMCLGLRFGLMAIKVALTCIIRDFAFQPTKDTQIPIKYHPGSIFLESRDGIYLKIVRVA